jgi:hypothetical protein
LPTSWARIRRRSVVDDPIETPGSAFRRAGKSRADSGFDVFMPVSVIP